MVSNNQVYQLFLKRSIQLNIDLHHNKDIHTNTEIWIRSLSKKLALHPLDCNVASGLRRCLKVK